MSTRASSGCPSAVISSFVFIIAFVSPAGADTRDACGTENSGNTEAREPSANCRKRDFYFTWNVQGIPGPAGNDGRDGAPGPAGPAGADGIDARLPTYTIGGPGPVGGFVFYVTDDGLHGYEAAPVDQGHAAWGCFRIDVNGARGTRLGSGRHNTDHIVAECETGTAADLADDYSLNGYNDWHLPSIDALTLMYTNLHALGQGGFASTAYWSSSEVDSPDAHVLHFNNGAEGSTDKPGEFNTLPGVRAVRAF